MTVVELIALLHYQWGVEPITIVGPNQLADIRETLLADGLIISLGPEERINGYTTTARGSKFVEMLCDTPIPIQLWGDPRDA